jgi:hypothetical protein
MADRRSGVPSQMETVVVRLATATTDRSFGFMSVRTWCCNRRPMMLQPSAYPPMG